MSTRVPDVAIDDLAICLAVSMAGLKVEGDAGRNVRLDIADYLGFAMHDRPDLLDEAIRRARDESAIRRRANTLEVHSNERALVVLSEAKRIRDEMAF
jgi:hypothetical protein